MGETTVASDAPRSRVSARIGVRAGQLLPGIDGRSWWTRRARELISAYTTYLGGPDNVNVAKRAIIRRVAVLQIELERIGHRFALLPDDVPADPADVDLYQRTSGGLRRLLETIGIEHTRDVTPPSIAEYLEQVRREGEEA